MSTKIQRRASIGGIRSRTVEIPQMTLDDCYHTVAKTILCNQNPLTGLFAVAKDMDHAWVRDNVYATMTVWGLSLGVSHSRFISRSGNAIRVSVPDNGNANLRSCSKERKRISNNDFRRHYECSEVFIHYCLSLCL